MAFAAALAVLVNFIIGFEELYACPVIGRIDKIAMVDTRAMQTVQNNNGLVFKVGNLKRISIR